jgi:hypothetical protein
MFAKTTEGRGLSPPVGNFTLRQKNFGGSATVYGGCPEDLVCLSIT